MYGNGNDKGKTLGDVWDETEIEVKPKDEGPAMGPSEMKMRSLAKKLGIEDFDSFSRLVMLITENC